MRRPTLDDVARFGRLGTDPETGEPRDPVTDLPVGPWYVGIYLVPGFGFGIFVADDGHDGSPSPRIEITVGPLLVIATVDECTVRGCQRDAGHYGPHGRPGAI